MEQGHSLMEETSGGDSIRSAQATLSSPVPLTLRKLGVHDCRGGTLEKGVILVRKANGIVSAGKGRAQIGVTFLQVLVPLAGLILSSSEDGGQAVAMCGGYTGAGGWDPHTGPATSGPRGWPLTLFH